MVKGERGVVISGLNEEDSAWLARTAALETSTVDRE